MADAGLPAVLTACSTESIHTVRSWLQRGRIPDDQWKAFADAKLATLDELAIASAANPRKRATQQVAA